MPEGDRRSLPTHHGASSCADAPRQRAAARREGFPLQAPVHAPQGPQQHDACQTADQRCSQPAFYTRRGGRMSGRALALCGRWRVGWDGRSGGPENAAFLGTLRLQRLRARRTGTWLRGPHARWKLANRQVSLHAFLLRSGHVRITRAGPQGERCDTQGAQDFRHCARAMEEERWPDRDVAPPRVNALLVWSGTCSFTLRLVTPTTRTWGSIGFGPQLDRGPVGP